MDDTISRAKAIKALSTITMYKGSIPYDTAVMRIEELPPAQLGTNLAELGTDCISRQSAIDAFNTNINELVVGGEENAKTVENYLNRVLDKIKCLPPAQPKKGRWISADAMFHGVPFYCSECGENTWDTVMGKPRWKFCPMCGAKMEGVDDE